MSIANYMVAKSRFKDTDTIVVFYPNPGRVSFRYSWTVLIIITGSTINPGWQIIRLYPLVPLDLIFNLDWESFVLLLPRSLYFAVLGSPI